MLARAANMLQFQAEQKLSKPIIKPSIGRYAASRSMRRIKQAFFSSRAIALRTVEHTAMPFCLAIRVEATGWPSRYSKGSLQLKKFVGHEDLIS